MDGTEVLNIILAITSFVTGFVAPLGLGILIGNIFMNQENSARMKKSLFKQNLGILHILRKGSRVDKVVVDLNNFKKEASGKVYSLEIPRTKQDAEESKDIITGEKTKTATFPQEKDKFDYIYYSGGLPYLYCKDDDFRLIAIDPKYYVAKIDPAYLTGVFMKQKKLEERRAEKKAGDQKLFLMMIIGGVALAVIIAILNWNSIGSIPAMIADKCTYHAPPIGP